MSAEAPLILVVEDDYDVRDAVVDVLADAGYRVVEAANGHEALTLLRQGLVPALILLDLMMPVLDGYGFRAEQLKAPELARIPVVVVTAARGADDARRLAAADYVPKPANVAELLNVVKRLAA